MAKVCIACEQEKGAPHLSWCPVLTGTLASLPKRNEAEANEEDHR